jgi:hypothetical protein
MGAGRAAGRQPTLLRAREDFEPASAPPHSIKEETVAGTRADAATARTTKAADRSVSGAQHAARQLAFGGREWAVELLDVQEQMVRSVADYQLRTADSTRLPWFATIARGQADVLVSVTDVYVSAARRLLVK